MHDQEITHCHFREDCLGIDKRGILYLHNPGIAERLIAVQREEDDDLGSSARLKLSANMKSIDVACWANSVAGLMIGRPVLTYEFDEWDETELRKAEAGIFGDLGKTSALGKFLMQCLRGRMFDSVGYNSGREALKELDRIPPAPTFK